MELERENRRYRVGYGRCGSGIGLGRFTKCAGRGFLMIGRKARRGGGIHCTGVEGGRVGEGLGLE